MIEIGGTDFPATVQSLSITGLRNSLKYCSFFTFFSVLPTIVSTEALSRSPHWTHDYRSINAKLGKDHRDPLVQPSHFIGNSCVGKGLVSHQVDKSGPLDSELFPLYKPRLLKQACPEGTL